MHYRNCKLDKETQILTTTMGPSFGLLTVRPPVSLYGDTEGVALAL